LNSTHPLAAGPAPVSLVAPPVRALAGVPEDADVVDVSVVVPVKDERESIEELVRRVRGAVRETPRAETFEIVLVDDGSTDGTWRAALEACAECREVRAVRHRRNFGKATGLATGIGLARGRVVITMDGDLQDDPAEIPRFLDAIADGADVVSGWKRRRQDPLGKRLPSKLFNWVTRRLTGVELQDFNCGFKAYSDSAAAALGPYLYGELHRYLPALLAAQGYRVAELEVLHHARRFGRSKYGAGRMLKGALDLVTVLLLTRFRHRPLHAFGSLAMASFAAGMALAASAWAAFGASAALEVLTVTASCAVAMLVAGTLSELVVHGMGPTPAERQVAERAGAWQPR
jgi:glycosyltransferase involved in cell wall biosynthesis